MTDIAFGESGVDEQPSDKTRAIKAVMVEPNKTPKTTNLKLSIDAFNKAVSIGTGYDCLARCKKLENGVYLLYADESNALFFTPKKDITVTLNVA